MSWYPRRYPVLSCNAWTLDDFSGGTHSGTSAGNGGLTLEDGCGTGVYLTSFTDPGQAVKWTELVWDADIPEGASVVFRTRTGNSEETCQGGRWTSKYYTSPSRIKLISSPEGSVKMAADRVIQVRVEMKAGDGGVPALRSIGLKCELVPPAGVGPKNYAEIEPGAPVFYWTRVEGAASYEFQLAENPGFTDVIVDRKDISQSRFSIEERLDEGTYYWRIRAVDGTGRCSEYSLVKQFTVKSFSAPDLSGLRHPYLYFSREDIPAIKERFEGPHKETWKLILEKADKALEVELPDEKDVLLEPGQHGAFHELNGLIHNNLMPLACASVFSGETKYIEKTRQMLLRLCEFSRWTGVWFGDASRFYPVWNATLETSMIGRYAAIAYDWIYDHLSEEDRVRVRAALMRLCVLPMFDSWADPATIRYVPRHQVGAGNWWTVCNSGGAVAALALINDVPDCLDWVRAFTDSARDFLTYPGGDTLNFHLQAGHGEQNLQIMERNWGEDGGYIESIGYAHYALTYTLYFLYPLKRTLGVDLSSYIHPRIADTPLYFGYRSNTDGKWTTIDFNDSNPMNWSDDCYALLSRIARNGRARYMLDNTWPVFDNIIATITEDQSVDAVGPDIEHRNRLFGDIGWCVFRSGWDGRESLLTAKFKEGRGHNDIGQYVINYNGRQFVADSGTVAYMKAIYGQYLRTSQAHNVVIVDDTQQLRIDGNILGYADVPGAGIVEADLTPAYQDLVEEWKRTLVYLEPGCFVVVDRLVSDEERSFSWLVHPAGKSEIVPGEGIVINQDDCRMHLHLASIREWDISVKEGCIKGESADYFSFDTSGKCRDVLYAGVFVGSGIDEAVEVERLMEGGRIGFRITSGNNRYIVFVNPDASKDMVIDGYTAGEGVHAVAVSTGCWVSAGCGALRKGETVVSASDGKLEYKAGNL